DQLRQMQSMGGMGGIMGMMPGMGKMKDQMAAAGFDDRMFGRQIAIIQSMTKAERANPDLLKHSRKKRIAAGSGTDAGPVDQLRQMQSMGGMGGIMGMMPGMGKMKDQMAAAGFDDRMFGRQIAIIQSMTKAERANPDLLKHSRKKRIAAGSGTDAAQINKLL